MNSDYINENTIKYTIDVFSDTIALKISQLRKYIKKNKNSALTGSYIEELVRGFIQQWLGHRLLLQGTFYSGEFSKLNTKPLQIDGIIYDPKEGPPIIKEGNFAIVHPVFCPGVIEIKMSLNKSLEDFEKRLENIHELYMHHLSKNNVMGVVIYDPDPEKLYKKLSNDSDDYRSYLCHHATPAICPIFILFKEENNEYIPYRPAIQELIIAIYSKINRQNFLRYLK